MINKNKLVQQQAENSIEVVKNIYRKYEFFTSYFEAIDMFCRYVCSVNLKMFISKYKYSDPALKDLPHEIENRQINTFYEESSQYNMTNKCGENFIFDLSSGQNKINWNIDKFIEVYADLPLNLLSLVIKEEILTSCYISKNILDFKQNNYDPKLWVIACFLESSSFYEFKTIKITPKKFGFPPNLDAISYYYLLLNAFNNFCGNNDNNNSDKNQQTSENEQSEHSSENQKSSENEQNDSSGKNQQSQEDEQNNFSENLESSNGDGIDIETFEKFIQNYNLSKETYLKIIEYSDKLDTIPKTCGNFLNDRPTAIWEKSNNSKDSRNIKIFKNIEKEIFNVEEIYNISRVKKTNTYFKCSWKTHERMKDGKIIFPGKKTISEGVSKKFKDNPIIFIDVSGSTRCINNNINMLISSFNNKGYSIGIYNDNLVSILPPNSVTLEVYSHGGTFVMKAMEQYFKLYYKIPHSEAAKKRIYVITDGEDDIAGALKTYPKTTVFKLEYKSDKIILSKITKDKTHRLCVC